MGERRPAPETTSSSHRGRIAVGSIDQPRLAPFVAGRSARVAPIPDDPWSLAGELFETVVGDEHSHAMTLDAALRGADVIAAVAPDRLAGFVEDAERAGLVLWSGTDSATPAEWAPLLDALAAGASTEEAARRCHVSVRTAHRRLADARAVLGVSSTAAAVARWSASGVGRA